MRQVRSLGALPRSPQMRAQCQVGAPCALPVGSGSVVQKIAFVRNQQAKPSCVGQSVASCVDAVIASDAFPVSAVHIWIDARRRQNDLEGALDGTRVEYALASIVNRGVDRYSSIEDVQDTSLDVELPTLMAELEADAHRLQVNHYAIVDNRSTQVRQALQAGHGVVMCTGVGGAYFDIAFNKVATPVELDPSYITAGHAQRVFAYFDDLGLFGVVNSWGQTWGGFALSGTSTGTPALYNGCVLVEPAVIENAWDIDVFDLTGT